MIREIHEYSSSIYIFTELKLTTSDHLFLEFGDSSRRYAFFAGQKHRLMKKHMDELTEKQFTSFVHSQTNGLINFKRLLSQID